MILIKFKSKICYAHRIGMQGMSLVEAIGAAGILAIVLATIAGTAMYAGKTQMVAEQKSEAQAFTESLAGYFSDKQVNNANNTSCVLAGQPYSTTSTTQLSVPVPNGLPIKAPSYSINSQLVLKKFEMTDSGNAPILVKINSSTYNRYTANVKITVSGNNNLNVPNIFIQDRILDVPVMVDTSTNLISSCGNSLTQQDLCASTGGSWDTSTSACIQPTRYEYAGAFSSWGYAGAAMSVYNPYQMGFPNITNSNNQLQLNPAAKDPNSGATPAQDCPKNASEYVMSQYTYSHTAGALDMCTCGASFKGSCLWWQANWGAVSACAPSIAYYITKDLNSPSASLVKNYVTSGAAFQAALTQYLGCANSASNCNNWAGSQTKQLYAWMIEARSTCQKQ